jgi:hypothetical protein
MGMKIDYTDHTSVLNAVRADQKAEEDRRETVREVKDFLHKKDGQWEPSIISKFSGRPRYTFDQCNPVVDQIATEVENMDFGIKVAPMDKEASDDVADLYAGMIRAIETDSQALDMVYNPAARSMIESGFDCWEVVQDWASDDSFDQDLLIEKIPNASDRVWFDQGAVKQDMSDANHATVLQKLTKDEYEKRFPEGSGMSVDSDNSSNSYSHKPDAITIGKFLYRKVTERELVMMSDGRVYVDDKKYQAIKDELADVGIVESRRRKRKVGRFYSRLYDGGGWLNDEQETVFSTNPIIPVYGNFSIDENKVIYRGAVERLLDPQRVYNYSESRQVEDVALSPKDKTWMTDEQAEGHHDTLKTMNTNADPIQMYKHVPGQPPPSRPGGTRVDPGLQNVSNNMRQNISQAAGMFAANMGDNPGLQSGVAIKRLQDTGNSSADKYINSMKIAICRTFAVLQDAIPRAYDSTRTKRIVGEDGVGELVTLNDTILDEQTGNVVSVRDLSKGRYTVACEVGKSYTSRKEEGNAALLELAAVKPEFLERGGDIILNNTNAPGLDLLAERERARLLDAGLIPFGQMTDEEKEQARAAAQANANQEDPATELINRQLGIEEAKEARQAQDSEIKNQVAMGKVINDRLKLTHQKDVDQSKLALDAAGMRTQSQVDMANILNTMADALNKLREAQGIDVITGPHTQEAYIQQADMITEIQDEINVSNIEPLAQRDIN